MARLALLDHSPKSREWGLGALQGVGVPRRIGVMIDHSQPSVTAAPTLTTTVMPATTVTATAPVTGTVMNSSRQVVWRWRRHQAAGRTRNRTDRTDLVRESESRDGNRALATESQARTGAPPLLVLFFFLVRFLLMNAHIVPVHPQVVDMGMGMGHIDTLLYGYTSRVQEGKYMLADRTGMVLLAHLKNFATFRFEINPLIPKPPGTRVHGLQGDRDTIAL